MPQSPKAPDYSKRKIVTAADVRCNDCNFTDFRWIDINSARRVARNHMRRTGHNIVVSIRYDELMSLD